MTELPAGDLALLARARRPKRHTHVWDTLTVFSGQPLGPESPALWSCRCGLTRSEYEARQRRGRLARSRGIKIQRQRNQGLGMRNLSGNNPNLDGMSELFASESKSGGAFSERYWRWLKGVKLITSQQVPILIVTDTPGAGRKARAVVVIDYDDWKKLHGE